MGVRVRYVLRYNDDGKSYLKEVSQNRKVAISPQFIPDDMDATWNPVDGEHYTSKSKMRKRNLALGYHEIGNDYSTPDQQRKRRAQNERSEAKARNEHFECAFQQAYQQATGKSWV